MRSELISEKEIRKADNIERNKEKLYTVSKHIPSIGLILFNERTESKKTFPGTGRTQRQKKANETGQIRAIWNLDKITSVKEQ